MIIYNKVHILPLLVSLCKNRFIAYDLQKRIKRSQGKGTTIRKGGYNYQKKGVRLSKKGVPWQFPNNNNNYTFNKKRTIKAKNKTCNY